MGAAERGGLLLLVVALERGGLMLAGARGRVDEGAGTGRRGLLRCECRSAICASAKRISTARRG